MNNPNPALEVIAGNDLTLAVEFEQDGEVVKFQEGDKISLILHKGKEEIQMEPVEIGDSKARFYLSSELTQSLLKNGLGSTIFYCIQIDWADGGRSTPIYRQKMTVRGC